MKDIVKKIMESEKEVRASVEAARAEAQQIVRDSEVKNREIIEQGRQKAVMEGQNLLESMKREAEEERKVQVSQVKIDTDSVMKKRGSEIDRTVAMIKDLVTGKNRI